jgi:murein L,D-transpeptidase YcbB/YkuD
MTTAHRSRPPLLPAILPAILRTIPLAFLCCCALPLAAATPGLPLDRAGEALSARIELLRADGRVVVAGEALVSHVTLPMLYEEGGFRLLWRDPQRLESLIGALRGVAADGLEPNDYHLATLVRLAATTPADAPPAARADLDLLASDALVTVLYHLYMGKVDPLAIETTWNFDPKTVRYGEALAFLERALASGRIAEALDEARPRHWMYASGRRALAEYRRIAAHGGWETLPAGRSLEPDASDARVPALRRRLGIAGDYGGVVDDSTRYDEALVAAVRGALAG